MALRIILATYLACIKCVEILIHVFFCIAFFHSFSVLITILADDFEMSAGVSGPGAFTANKKRYDQ